MVRFKDLMGKRFSRLIVVSRMENDKHGRARWLCKCDCGEEVTTVGSLLLSGHTRSCGCLQKEMASSANIVDYTGVRFGKLVAIDRIRNGERLDWLCQCDCGNTTTVSVGDLVRKGKGAVRSCGCLKKGNTNRRLASGEACFNNIYYSYKSRSDKRGIPFELDKEYFRQLTKGKCFYCGCEPNQIYKTKNNNGNYIYNGIDRVIPSLGYVEGNVVSCCWRCNASKSDLTKEEFINWIKKAYDHIFIQDKLYDLYCVS
jgi:hypothetical protein